MQVLVILLGLLVVPGISGCGCIGFESKHKVAMPPRDASPEKVVRTYFDAIAGQDKETARALLTTDADFGHELEDSYGPFHTWVTATDLNVEGPYEDGDCRPGATCVSMLATFDLGGCPFAEGPTGLQSEPFGLRLTNGRWLIYGHGQG